MNKRRLTAALAAGVAAVTLTVVGAGTAFADDSSDGSSDSSSSASDDSGSSSADSEGSEDAATESVPEAPADAGGPTSIVTSLLGGLG